jgi:ABC-type Fe3+ transport system permease subunit
MANGTSTKRPAKNHLRNLVIMLPLLMSQSVLALGLLLRKLTHFPSQMERGLQPSLHCWKPYLVWLAGQSLWLAFGLLGSQSRTSLNP